MVAITPLILACLVAGSLAAPLEADNKKSKPIAAANPPPSGNFAGGDAPDKGERSAASPGEVEKARTRSLLNYFFGPGVAHPYHPQTVVLPYLKPVSFVQPPSFGQVHVPIAAPVAHVAPALPCASSAPQPAPVAVSTAVTKPVLTYRPQVVQKPAVTISQHVVHRPVVTEYQQVIRRPVIAEIVEVVHKPVFTEYQQVYKPFLYTQHIVKPPSYNAIKQESYQSPLHLNSQQYHVVDKPESQVLQLPAQYLQPYTNEVVHVPTVHHQTETATTLHVPAAPVVPSVPSYQPAVSGVPAYLPGLSSAASFPPAGSSIASYPALPSAPAVSSISSYPAVTSFGSYPALSSGLSYYPASGPSGIGVVGSYGYGSYPGAGNVAAHWLTPSLDCRSGECKVRRNAEGQIVYENRNDLINPSNRADITNDDYEPTDKLSPSDRQQMTHEPNDVDPQMMKVIAERAIQNPYFVDSLNKAIDELKKELPSPSLSPSLSTSPSPQSRAHNEIPADELQRTLERLVKTANELNEQFKTTISNDSNTKMPENSSHPKNNMKSESSKATTS